MNALSCGGYATVQDAAMLALADARFSKSEVLVYLAVLRGEQLDQPPSARDLQRRLQFAAAAFGRQPSIELVHDQSTGEAA